MAKRSTILEFALLFAVVYLGSQFVLRMFFPEQFGGTPAPAGIVLTAQDPTITIGHHPILSIRNGTANDLVLEDRCPAPPVDVYAVEGETRRLLTASGATAVPCLPVIPVVAGETVLVDLGPWKYSLFERVGRYEMMLPGASGATVGADDLGVAHLDIREPGMITQVFRSFITKPFLNLLILIASVMPGYNLGMAIIILTIIVKLVLYIPTQHAMEGQKKLQAVQPKLDALKEKYKGDPQALQKETMRIWKEEKINPLQSCLPMVIQFPILIGLFYVIRDGSVLDLSRHLLYAPHIDLPWHFGTNFLGLDLLKPDLWVMPAGLMILQFLQMKLSFAMAKKKKQQKEKIIDVGPEKKKEMDPMEMQQKVMLYGLPLMIGFFAFQFPAAVSLYWGISTLFAIGQQFVVNRKVS